LAELELVAPARPRHAVECIGVTKRFGDTTVLDQLDLTVEYGEKVAIIGPSGSGKTTLLRLLMTLERPTSGSLVVDGDRLWSPHGSPGEKRLRRVRSKVGYVFQQFNLFPHMTALRNITEAPRHVLGIPQEEADARAMQLLEMVGLGDKASSYPAQLSGGQQQRVAIARALALGPKVMLFDEVTSALDPELVGEVLRVIRELAQEGNMTMLLVTHEMRFARQIADRVSFIDGGRIVEQGPPDRVLTDPAEPRTRKFLKAVLEPI
jgi:polar amino acid transport system ATP-binding protein